MESQGQPEPIPVDLSELENAEFIRFDFPVRFKMYINCPRRCEAWIEKGQIVEATCQGDPDCPAYLQIKPGDYSLDETNSRSK